LGRILGTKLPTATKPVEVATHNSFVLGLDATIEKVIKIFFTYSTTNHEKC
jgi:hypothetical protein